MGSKIFWTSLASAFFELKYFFLFGDIMFICPFGFWLKYFFLWLIGQYFIVHIRNYLICCLLYYIVWVFLESWHLWIMFSWTFRCFISDKVIIKCIIIVLQSSIHEVYFTLHCEWSRNVVIILRQENCTHNGVKSFFHEFLNMYHCYPTFWFSPIRAWAGSNLGSIHMAGFESILYASGYILWVQDCKLWINMYMNIICFPVRELCHFS